MTLAIFIAVLLQASSPPTTPRAEVVAGQSFRGDLSPNDLALCEDVAVSADELRAMHRQAFVDLGAEAVIPDVLPMFSGASERDQLGLAEIRRQAVENVARYAETVAAIDRVAGVLDRSVTRHCLASR